MFSSSEVGSNISIVGKNPLGLWMRSSLIMCLSVHSSPFRPHSGVMWSWLHCSHPDISNLFEWYHLIPRKPGSYVWMFIFHTFNLSTNSCLLRSWFYFSNLFPIHPSHLDPHCLHRPLLQKTLNLPSAFREDAAFTRCHSVSFYLWCLNIGSSTS